LFQPVWRPAAEAEYRRLKEEAEKSLRDRSGTKARKATAAEGLFKQVHGCARKLLDDPRHPGLRTNKYDSITNPYKKGEPVFEAYAQNATPGPYRVFWCFGPAKKEITFIAITPHP
jgi:hypothetical protein